MRCIVLCLLLSYVLSQVPEAFGPVRAVTEGKQGELLVGTTKNTILTGSFPETLNPIVQVHNLSIANVTYQ